MKVVNIIERGFILEDINKFGIKKQYIKAKNYIISGELKNVDFKIRQPKESKIYQFRITKKYRAICILEKDELRVMEINKHQ